MDFNKLANNVKGKLQNERCSQHGKSATITISGSSSNPSISVSGCCDAFVKKIKDKAVDLFESEVSRAVEDDLKNMFK